MSADCESLVSESALIDYFAGDLPTETAERLEDHVFDCDACAPRFEAAGALARALREAIPPVITHAKLAEFEKLGWQVERIAIGAGTRVNAHFAAHLRLLIF